eukprot:248668_1
MAETRQAGYLPMRQLDLRIHDESEQETEYKQEHMRAVIDIHGDDITSQQQLKENQMNYQQTCSHCCDYCQSSKAIEYTVDVTDRINFENRSLLTVQTTDDDPTQSTLSISHGNNVISLLPDAGASQNDNQSCIIQKDDILRKINEQSLKDMDAMSVLKLLRCEELGFSVTFQRGEINSFCNCCACCGTDTKRRFLCKTKSSQKSTSSGKPAQWVLKFVKLSLKITSRISSLLDAVTDAILLYKVSSNNAMLVTLLLFISLISPYILSYSAGVELWLFHDTFSNLKLCTFTSFLLLFYLFPTGFVFFIILDVVDVFVELYKWFSYGIVGKIKTNTELVQVEASTANYFGMSRMDYFSLKRQKSIAQLFFETVPQLILQTLLFTAVIGVQDELTGVSSDVLMLSICSASFNFVIQTLRLKAESVAVRETFVQYSLHSITARFGWLPFKHLIKQSGARQKRTDNKSKTCCWRWCSFEIINDDDEPTLDYRLRYRLPIVTAISEYSAKSNNTKELCVGRKLKYETPAYGLVEFDFSSGTVNELISAIKSISHHKRSCELSIVFGKSLRLLNVRDIITLMQACSQQKIDLPDIHEIEWNDAFKNSAMTNTDARLLDNTFDDDDKPLLTSLYLTGYDADNHNILRSFVKNYNVPINITDKNGNTILHHMLHQNDDEAMNIILSSLKPHQRINVNAENDNGVIVFHEIIKQNGVNGFKMLLKSLKGKETINFQLQNKKGDTILHEIIRKNDYDEMQQILELITAKSKKRITWGAFNDSGESCMFTALERDRNTLLGSANDEKQDEPLDDVGFDDFDQYRITKAEIDLVFGDKSFIVQDMDTSTVIHITYLKIWKIESENTLVNANEFKQIKAKLKSYYEAISSIVSTKVQRKVDAKMMHRLLLQYDPKLAKTTIHRDYEQTALGYLFDVNTFNDLNIHLEDIMDVLSKHNACLLSNETPSLHNLFLHILDKPNPYSYFHQFRQIVKKCEISMENVRNELRDNPIHEILKPKVTLEMRKSDDRLKSNEKKHLHFLPMLCAVFPEWVSSPNCVNEIPMSTAIKQEEMDSFYCLCTFMIQNNMNIRMVLSRRHIIEEMIELGSRLLENKCVQEIQCLLAIFDYGEIFYWASNRDVFDTEIDSDDISLIKFVSGKKHHQTLNDILIVECGVEKERIKIEAVPFESNDDEDHVIREQKQNEDRKEDKDDEPQVEPLQTNYEIGVDERTNALHDLDEDYTAVNWIEFTYSSLVEVISVVDLYYDCVVFERLYGSNNPWWSTWMLLFLISPYLVAHSSLVTLLQKKIDFDNLACCKSFGLWLMVTPVSLIYAFTVDVIFMSFSIISTIYFIIAFLLIKIVGICKKDMPNVANYDIRDWIEVNVFQKLLDMNKSELTGYRRLRTLSQLLFETIPQIGLQLRILYVIKWSDDIDTYNAFKIDVKTLAWSIGFAAGHLLLESGIIYLEKRAFRIPLMQYCLTCLGGRVQWIPFQDEVDILIQNQIYMKYDEVHSWDPREKANFNPQRYQMNEKKAITINYENIYTDIGCFKYRVKYRFSSQSVERLINKLLNASPKQIPSEFKLTTTNDAMQHFFKYLLCSAQIILGPKSCGNMDIRSLCNLYTASLYKIPINIKQIDIKTIQKLQDGEANDGDVTHVWRSFINCGEIAAIQWIHGSVSYDHKIQIKSQILDCCLPTSDNDIDFIKLDVLQKCYKNNFFVGLQCEQM